MENKKGHKKIIRNKTGLRVVRLNRRRAIRYFYAECVGWETSEIDRCSGKHLDGSMCSLHPFRSGQGKQNAVERDAAIKNQCRYCMRRNFSSINRCTSRYCPIYPYRINKIDRTYFYLTSFTDDEILKSGLQN